MERDLADAYAYDMYAEELADEREEQLLTVEDLIVAHEDLQ